MRPPALLPLILAAAVASADTPDLSSEMVPLCNPNASRWTASQAYARAATSIGVCDGRLFVSGGDWDDNLGPCPIFAVDPYSGEYVKEYESGTESIDYFRYGSDGCLYAPSVDPREGHANQCDVARRNADGSWTKLNIAPNRWLPAGSENAAYGTHTWDVAIWKGKIFTAGYGIGAGPEKSTSRLSDATPGLTDAYRQYPSAYGGTFQQYRRFYAFLPFEDDLFCYPLNYATVQENNFKVWDFEEWRYNESTGKFVCQTNMSANVVPGLSRSDMPFLGSNVYSTRLQLWHPTAFKGRVLYIAGIPEMTTFPFVLYSATNQNHSVRATRVDLGSGVVPFDVFVRGDIVSVLAAQYDSTAQKAVNSVWESTDGVNFTKKFIFSGVQYANALAYCDGAYYVAMGARQIVQNAWTFTGTDEVGRIYRIRDPDFADAIQVVAESEAVSVPEGGTGVVRFKLAAQPAAPVTATVRLSGGIPAVSAGAASVTFTPQDWDAWHEVPLTAAEDDIEKTAAASLVCGAGDPAAFVPASIKVTPVNNDFRVADVPPAGIVDITVPNGDFTTTSTTSIHTNNPFNDDLSGTNTAARLLVQSKSVTITYDFVLPATVTGYGIHNFVPSGYSPAERAPHTWKFQSSNDGAVWTTLDERKLESGWTAGEYRYYAVSNATAYTQYRLAVTDNNGNDYTQFARLEFYGTGTSLVPLTTASAGALCTNSTSHATYGAKGAFDGNRSDTNGRWLATKADHMYVVYKFNEATAVNVLRVWNGSNSGGGVSSAERSPKAWTFYGSNDGETWTPLNARANETGWSANGESRLYPFSNDEAYLYYKYDCTELCGASATYLQLWELEFYYIAEAGSGDDPGGDGPSPEVVNPAARQFAKRMSFTPSPSALSKIGVGAWTDFPVLLRLPAAVSSQLRSADGTDLFVQDENGAAPPFEVDTFDPAGTTLVWAKVPSLSAATKLTVYFSGPANTDNDPAAVWTRYAGVWHFAPAVSGTTAVPDATGHGLDAATTNALAAYAGPAGLGAAQASAFVRAPDYEPLLANAAQFSASGWFKAPTQVSSWWTVASKKVGITTGPNGENLWNIDKGWYLQMPQVKNKLNLVYTNTGQMDVPDVTANWNYFSLVSDGSTVKVYLNGSSSAAKSVSYTVKASGTPYQICPKDGCSREYRLRIGAASAAETALEYATMADTAFFGMGAVEDVPIAVDLPETLVIGTGDGGGSPVCFVQNAAGEECFRVVLANAVPGVWFTAFAATSLDGQFHAQADSTTVSAAGPLPFDIPTEGRSSLFVTIVASEAPFEAGAPLPSD